MDQKKVLYKNIKGKRIDIGTLEGYLEAIINFAKKDKNLMEIIKKE